ncbi:MAG: HRDC domain-containing protein, partial [Dehalococcoidia bacterium]
ATSRPASEAALLEVWGIGPARVRWFGRDVLRIVSTWESAHPEAAPPPRTAGGARRQRVERVSIDAGPDDIASTGLYRRLREWRAERARRDGVPAYTVFSDRTLRELAAAHPTDMATLLQTWGLGSSRVARFGTELLDVIAGPAEV